MPGHVTQVAADVAPVKVEYVPTPQDVHPALPLAILYVPAIHDEQTPPSGPEDPALQVQSAMASLELGELELPGHVRQAAAVAPVEVEYVPTPQDVQAALPLAILYVPAAHGEHAPPFRPVNPALQAQAAAAVLRLAESESPGHVTQVAAAVAPVEAEYVPAPQDVHPALPLAILYVPAIHDEHTPPSGPVYPALQVQSATASLELGELELSGHVTQVAAAVAAVTPEYVPAPHGVQAALPLAILYVPAIHDEHTPPSGPVNPALQVSGTHGPPFGPLYPVLQVQAVTAELVVGELELPGHVWQAALPIAILYVPTPHGEQTPPFGPVYPAVQLQTELELSEF